MSYKLNVLAFRLWRNRCLFACWCCWFIRCRRREQCRENALLTTQLINCQNRHWRADAVGVGCNLHSQKLSGRGNLIHLRPLGIGLNVGGYALRESREEPQGIGRDDIVRDRSKAAIRFDLEAPYEDRRITS